MLFELWCWRSLFRVPRTARRSNQCILKEINPEYSSEGLMLKLQYFGHLMQKTNSLEKTLMLGKIEGRNINNLRYADDTTIMAKSKQELKNFLMKVKEENEKAGLKLNIQKTKIMASGPIVSWQREGETMGTVRDFTFWGFQNHCMVTAAMK